MKDLRIIDVTEKKMVDPFRRREELMNPGRLACLVVKPARQRLRFPLRNNFSTRNSPRTMLDRILEPEAMDTPEDAASYDAMDHAEVNARFVRDVLAQHGPARGGWILDVGTGTARIPIELCRQDPRIRVLGIDLARSMLDLGDRNVREAGLADQIRLEHADAKALRPDLGLFEAVVSNSIVHHIPEPASVLEAMFMRVEPGGTLFVRDLARPETRVELERLVELYAGSEPEAARALFADSLHAALSVDEVRLLAGNLGLPPEGVSLTSDRHWTLVWHRPPILEQP